ncbi:enoyl-CoA hydratase/isomerase family protein [Bacillus sp. V5-8f]|uniref:enoyl-CoA hydratase/isomerase family protein n=1 Tax=Bacillus sp. V5-8f TaxID=2053044 RepID=UPI000C77A251|nr:enoyl-CoA hydratase/isomerase family protein [Bacillus sp. V5-8f]PLT34312.1 enoyl-CoA hydratase [Bacillus sp. V5-8f]
MSNVVLAEKKGDGSLLVTINRPEKRNAINYEVMDRLLDVLSDAENDETVKLLMITGAGDDAFCSGGDLSEFHALHTEADAYKMLSKMGTVIYKLATFPKPTVAFLNGSAVGGGSEIAVACDYRIARQKVKFGFVQGKQAITTGWGGGSLLFEKLPYQTALKLLLTASVVSGSTGKELGFIDSIVPDSATALDTDVTELVLFETGVIQAYKQMVVRKWKLGGLEERMQQEIAQCAKLWETEAHHQAVQSFLNKKK